MIQMEETLADQRKIEAALASGQFNLDAVDEDELEKELDELVMSTTTETTSSPVAETNNDIDTRIDRVNNLTIPQERLPR